MIREALRAPAVGSTLIAMLKLVMAGMLVSSGCLTGAGDNDSLEVECGVAWPAARSVQPNFNDFTVEWRCQTPGFCDAALDQGSTLTTTPAEGLWAWMGVSFGGGEMTHIGVTQRADGCFVSDTATACPRSEGGTPGAYAFSAYLVTYTHGRERWMGCAR